MRVLPRYHPDKSSMFLQMPRKPSKKAPINHLESWSRKRNKFNKPCRTHERPIQTIKQILNIMMFNFYEGSIL